MIASQTIIAFGKFWAIISSFSRSEIIVAFGIIVFAKQIYHY